MDGVTQYVANPEHSPSYSYSEFHAVTLFVLFLALAAAGTRSFADSTAMRAKVKRKSSVSFS